MSPKRPEQVTKFCTTRRRVARHIGAALFVCLALPAQALTLDLPAPATTIGERRAALTSYRLPVGPFSNGALPAQVTEGALGQTAWALDAPGRTTLELLAPLRAQVTKAGFETVFECETLACGGFDFRFATDVLPEPEMHVDLGDFRFLSATRQGPDGTEALSLLVSRSADKGFVQLTLVGDAARIPADLSLSTKSAEPAAPLPAEPQQTATPAPEQEAGDFAGLITSGTPVVLEDLIFASGSAALSPGDYPSLTALADWLRAHPDDTVALVGHTDASGSLPANTALSEKRAASVRVALIALGINGDRMTAAGVGPLTPRASNATEAGRQKNRRVEVILTSTR